MSFHRPTEFSELQDDLTALFQATAAQYAKNQGLEPFSADDLRQMSVELREVAGETLMFGCNAWPESARPAEVGVPFEIAPSEVDPPWYRRILTWHVLTLAITVPATFVLSYFSNGPLLGFFFMFGVITISLFCGETQAIVHSVIAGILNNFFVVAPTFAFTMPTGTEWGRLAVYLVAALLVPWLARRAAKGRHRYVAQSSNR